jgi:cation diffusion facilitator CzcD-associated flavoprotein CzcO
VSVAIVGAGIGGLTAALALLQAGFDSPDIDWLYGTDPGP